MRHDSRRLLPYFLIILSKMPPVVSDVVVAAAVEDCSGYFSANVEFVQITQKQAPSQRVEGPALMHYTKKRSDHQMRHDSRRLFLNNPFKVAEDNEGGVKLLKMNVFVLGLPDDRCGSAGVKLLMTLADIN
ncbi:hypothetical protein Tco_0630350 [Tanacetum coccineum]